MEFLNPEQALNQLGIYEGMVCADFGSGSGGWVLPLAKKIKGGRVYAVDIQDVALEALKTKAAASQLNNIRTVKADLESGVGSSIQNNLLDLVLMTNLLFQLIDKQKVISEANRVLRPAGRLLVVDWKPEASIGPQEGKIAPEEVKTMCQDTGFDLEKEIVVGTYHYGLVFQKK